MIDPLERIDKRLADTCDILKSQVALVELATADALPQETDESLLHFSKVHEVGLISP
jgi:hypothetical protein